MLISFVFYMPILVVLWHKSIILAPYINIFINLNNLAMSYYIENENGKKFEIKEGDTPAIKFIMLIEGETKIGRKAACKKYGYSEPRYFQILRSYKENGFSALINKKRGSEKKPVRTDEAIKKIINLRYLDPFASSQVIAQKLKQEGYTVSVRSVERTITEYGLQKKLMFLTKVKKKVKRI